MTNDGKLKERCVSMFGPYSLFLWLLLYEFCCSCMLFDQFDPLSVEAGQAATAVLMLDSNEDDVVIKATQGVYRFAEKCLC